MQDNGSGFSSDVRRRPGRPRKDSSKVSCHDFLSSARRSFSQLSHSACFHVLSSRRFRFQCLPLSLQIANHERLVAHNPRTSSSPFTTSRYTSHPPLHAAFNFCLYIRFSILSKHFLHFSCSIFSIFYTYFLHFTTNFLHFYQ